jgi:antitoxin YefM
MNKRTKTTLAASQARKQFFKILKEIDKPNQTYTITLAGRPKAVILSADEYQSWLETLEILNNPKLAKRLKKAEKEISRGEYVPFEEVLKDEGFVPAAKAGKKYEASGRSKKKSAKNPEKSG